MDIDSLEKYWSLISRHPWAFAWTFFTDVAVGIGIHKLWTAWTSVKPKALSAPVPRAKENSLDPPRTLQT